MSEQIHDHDSGSPQLPVRRLSPASAYERDLSRYGPAEDTNLRALLRVVRKRRALILGLVLIVTTLVTIDAFRTKPLFEATATIEINRDGGVRVRSTDVFIPDEDELYIALNTSEVILKSAPLLEDIVAQLRLDQNPAFLDTARKVSVMESLGKIAGRIQQKETAEDPPKIFTATTLQAKVDGSRTAEEIDRLAPYTRMLEESLQVKPIVDTRAMTISFVHADAALAAQIANAIATRFVQTSFDRKVETFTSASEWLDRSTRELKAKIERSEKALADYTEQNNIYSLEGKETLITEKLSRLHDQATRAETDRILKQSLNEQVREGRIAQIPEAFADPKTLELQRKLNDLEVTAAELGATFGPKNPKLAEVTQQIATVRDQIAGSRNLLQQKLQADYERAVLDEHALADALTEAKAGAAKENVRAIQYSILRQDVDTAKTLYTEFLQKTNQAYLEVAQQHSNIRIIAPARIPRVPVSPNRQRAVLLGLIVSLAAGIGLAWLLEHCDDSIRSVEDVNRFTQLPALAVIPAITANRRRRRDAQPEIAAAADAGAPSTRRARLMAFDSRSPASEAYRALRTSLLLSIAGNPPKKILVTSVRMSEGKTTTASNTAISLAQLGASVVLIDADLRKPAVHEVFGVERADGLSTYLSRNIDPREVTRSLEAESLDLIASGPTPPNPAELLSSERMKELLSRLSERYDHIVIDSPPLGCVTDPVILSTMVDGVILVVHGGKNSRNAVQRACHELSAVGARVFGIVLNNVNARREGYEGYYYAAGYGE